MYLIPLLLCAATPAASLSAGANEATIVVKVSDRDTAAESLIKKVEALGGYFAERTDQSVIFKVPRSTEDQVELHARTLGTVIDRQQKTEDLGFLLDRARSQLKSREEMMKRYLDVLASAGPGQVVTVEREIVKLIEEIELEKGSLKTMEHRIRYAKVTVLFQFRERKAPARDGTSSFAWINSVNLSDLLGDFRRE
jgi:hypothetical protein